MAEFTFRAGNARKIAGLPLYLAGAVASVIVPRSNCVWVFGCGIGLGEGALPLYLLARERLDESVRLVWLARTSAELQEATELGLDTLQKDSWRGFWSTLRARVVVVTHGFGDVNRYAVRGAYIVQLWHGLPFKHLHLDSPATYSMSFMPNIGAVRRLIGAAYRRAGRAISLFPVSSSRVAPSITSGFGVNPSRLAVTGDPRDDVLLRGTHRERRTRAQLQLREVLPDFTSKTTLVLFAPTWRDGAVDPTVPTAAEWTMISTWLESRDAVLVVRVHPLGRGDYAEGTTRSPRIVLMGPDLQRDINPVLSAFDAVITDYSSIVFDFALVGRPIVFFAPDLDTYAATRGFYVPFEEFTGGRAVTTWDETLGQLSAVLDEGPDGVAHRHAKHLLTEFFDHPDGCATERVYDAITAAIGPLARG